MGAIASLKATRTSHPDYDWDYWDAQVEVKCLVCEKYSPFCVTTDSGMICPSCAGQFLNDYLKMKNPWPKELMKNFELE
jgi:hypothetical protein|tara:strand:- start:208 stop:444 length:237 start_codon:yes stop_codon:yes gene_type:complete